MESSAAGEALGYLNHSQALVFAPGRLLVGMKDTLMWK